MSRTPPDPWAALGALTPARIALGRAGAAQPTRAVLAFGLAHAEARDAVHRRLDADALVAAWQIEGDEAIRVRSAVGDDRAAYLRRPDLGRICDETSARLLDARHDSFDFAIVVADGLSALAVERHAVSVWRALRPALRATGRRLAPVVIATSARVALGDDIAHRLGARCVAVMIGERPGLSSPDSLGIYVTWAPRPGRTDAERNCLSNIRPEGMSYETAARKLLWLIEAAEARGATGVALKDDSDAPLLAGTPPPRLTT